MKTHLLAIDQDGDTPLPVLRLVRDEDGVAPAPEDEPISESFYFDRKGTVRVDMKTARQFVIPRAVPFLTARAPTPRRSPRAPCVAAHTRRARRQHDLIERYQHLQVYGSRPRSIGRRKMSAPERRELIELTLSLAKGKHYAHRPKTWGECQERIAGPCPWVSCRHHMFLEVDEKTGVIKVNFPGKAITDLEETCSLRAATNGGMTLEKTGELLNITLERSRQIEEVALKSVKARAAGFLCEAQDSD